MSGRPSIKPEEQPVRDPRTPSPCTGEGRGEASDRRMAASPWQRLFELCCQPQEGSLVAVACNQLHTDGQPLARLSQRQAYGWLPCHVEERSKGDQREQLVEPASWIKALIVLVEIS